MEHSDRLDERIKNRRARRWKRRGRIIAPFLAIPLLLATLLLSVGLVEYQPVEPKVEPTQEAKATRVRTTTTPAKPAPHHATRAAMATSAIPSVDVLSFRPAEGSLQRAIEAAPVLPHPNELRPPSPPPSLDRR